MPFFLAGTLLLSFAQTPGKVSDVIEPSDAKVVYRVEGRGAQIYVCAQGEKEMHWVLDRPAAVLIDASGHQVGKHGYGPQWTWNDGSAVIGKVVGRRPSPDAGSVPWLLLSTDAIPGLVNTGGEPVRLQKRGALDGVTYVKRSETHGGVGPASGCDAAHIGASVEVPYNATYTFYTRGN